MKSEEQIRDDLNTDEILRLLLARVNDKLNTAEMNYYADTLQIRSLETLKELLSLLA